MSAAKNWDPRSGSSAAKSSSSLRSQKYTIQRISSTSHHTLKERSQHLVHQPLPSSLKLSEKDKTYIIGGLLDLLETYRHYPNSFQVATQLKVPSYKLPLKLLWDDKDSDHLGLQVNNVVELANLYLEEPDWIKSFGTALPKRYLDKIKFI